MRLRQEQVGLFVGAAPVAAGSIAKYMEQRMQERMREPSRAITLGSRVSTRRSETLRGSPEKRLLQGTGPLLQCSTMARHKPQTEALKTQSIGRRHQRCQDLLALGF